MICTFKNTLYIHIYIHDTYIYIYDIQKYDIYIYIFKKKTKPSPNDKHLRWFLLLGCIYYYGVKLPPNTKFKTLI